MRLMIIVGSVRPGRIGLPIAQWARERAEARGFDVDFVDLAELALPLMDEPEHPRLRLYTHPHTIAWSERVDAVDAVLLVTPEYNHGYSPALKNAIDYLNQEWWRKPVGFISYGGVSAGSRGAAQLTEVLATVGMVKVGANVEINFPARSVQDGIYTPGEKEQVLIEKELTELDQLAAPLAHLRAIDAAG